MMEYFIENTILKYTKIIFKNSFHVYVTSKEKCEGRENGAFLYSPHPKIQEMLWDSLQKVVKPLLVRWPFSKLRQKGSSHCDATHPL
jgi:cycloartenol synthase